MIESELLHLYSFQHSVFLIECSTQYDIRDTQYEIREIRYDGVSNSNNRFG